MSKGINLQFVAGLVETGDPITGFYFDEPADDWRQLTPWEQAKVQRIIARDARREANRARRVRATEAMFRIHEAALATV